MSFFIQNVIRSHIPFVSWKKNVSYILNDRTDYMKEWEIKENFHQELSFSELSPIQSEDISNIKVEVCVKILNF